MNRRSMLTGLAGVAAGTLSAEVPSEKTPTYLELKFWHLHNTPEKQGDRLGAYLEHGLAPALARSGARLDGAFSIVIGPDSPSYITLTEFRSLAAMEETLAKVESDAAHVQALTRLNGDGPLPFVRVESSLLRSFAVMPRPDVSAAPGAHPRVFELRTYESQNYLALKRKIGMFNDGEAGIFKRLGFRPVFFGETLVGPRQPNLTYMLSFDDLAARERLWHSFVDDPEWKRVSSTPGLGDAEVVENITNAMLAPLSFSAIR